MQAAKEAKIAQLISTAQSRADQEITRRINALNALSTRINNMVKVSASDKSSLSTEIQTQVTAMNTLQAQIASDAAADSTSSLKTDIQSITKAYRIFALVVPQGAIEAAADRVLDVAGMLTTLSAQLQTRITDAQNAGNNVSAETTAIADMNAKIADANTQANAATTEIASLQPDNGDQTIAASNTATLKDARSKIQAAQQDLTTARKDAGAIAKALFALKNPGVATTTTSVGGSARIRVKQSVKRDNNGKSVLAAHSSKPFVVVIYANATGHLDHLDGSMSVIVAERIDTDQKTSGKQALAIRYDGLALVYPAGRPVWEPSLPVL